MIRLNELPTVNRDELMGDFERWVSDPRLTLAGLQAHLEALNRPDDYYLGALPGDDDRWQRWQEGVFVFDRREWSLILALTLR